MIKYMGKTMKAINRDFIAMRNNEQLKKLSGRPITDYIKATILMATANPYKSLQNWKLSVY